MDEPTREFNVREVARLTKHSAPTVSKELKAMAQQKILKYRKERMLHLYRANLESESYRELKRFWIQHTLRTTGLIEELNEFYLKPTIVLFGSAAQGLDTETSDIDICVISETSKQHNVQKFEKKLKRALHIIPVTTISEIGNKHLQQNILNGTVIQGEFSWT